MLKLNQYKIHVNSIVCILCILLSSSWAFNEFDDSVLFRLSWPGSHIQQLSDSDENVVVMTTIDNEKYRCTLPSVKEDENNKDQTYAGASALELLQPLFSQLSCSYRLEQYWTYELCHGRYVKQYHDEKDTSVPNSKKLRRQEFLLGQFNAEDYLPTRADSREKISSKKDRKNIPTKKIESQSLPYFEIVMSDGTTCDLNNNARSAKILYICLPDSNNEIYAVEEVSSCEYEMIVLTSLLCAHPDYRLLKETIKHDIQCHSLKGSPVRPLQLEKIESENLRFMQKQKRLQTAYLKKLEEKLNQEKLTEEIFKYDGKTETVPNDLKLMDDFLNGRHCLYGGSGWWKFEFCNGNKVIQYHEYEDKRRIEVVLGVWNEDLHKQWIADNQYKKPKHLTGIAQKQTSHLYSGGTMCDSTGKPRQVEVKIKCKESSSHPNAVALYLLEPKTCEYILVVESSILCSLIETIDQNGLFSPNS
uniref:Endoplasmic reticulum lectin 1 n=1 Tax=Strigamia maritima TaxID=126957 RepID=T1JB26_STRMM